MEEFNLTAILENYGIIPRAASYLKQDISDAIEYSNLGHRIEVSRWKEVVDRNTTMFGPASTKVYSLSPSIKKLLTKSIL